MSNDRRKRMQLLAFTVRMHRLVPCCIRAPHPDPHHHCTQGACIIRKSVSEEENKAA